MSGGSYDYFYSSLNDMAYRIRSVGGCGPGYCASSPMRKAFAAHLKICAEACRAIEWNDSGDGDARESDLIRQCIAPDASLKQAISDARDALDVLTVELASADEALAK